MKGLIAKFFRQEGNETIRPPEHGSAEFLLKYGKSVIGKLSYEDGNWSFVYSMEFREQKVLTPLVEFPDVTLEYQSEHLWATFAGRIPSRNQPAVRNAIDAEQLDQDDQLALLARFGRSTVSSPFRLEPV